MLVRVQFENSKKFLKLQHGFTYADFMSEVQNKFGLSEETPLHLYDDSETEVDEDILLDLLQAKPDMVLIVRDSNKASSLSSSDILSRSSCLHDVDRAPECSAKSKTVEESADVAKRVVLAALQQKAGGDAVLTEYGSNNTLSSETRRVLVNIVVGHMMEMHGRIPTRNQKEQCALGIVTLFPSLRDPFSKKGYEHFYDADSGTGYLAWRLKTVQRNISHRPVKRLDTDCGLGGPSLKRSTNPENELDEDGVREAIAFLVHTCDEAQIVLKMKETFHHRYGLVHNPDTATDVLQTYPRFLDTKGLVNQDFTLLFSAETASKMLERWDTAFKTRIIEEAVGLTLTSPVRSLLFSARKETDTEDHSNWDSDMATLLLLTHLLPPPPGGKKAVKISAIDAADRLVVYHKSCNSIEEHLRQKEERQPYLLAVGRSRGQIDNYYIVLDKKLIPCQAVGSLSAFDELFKAHFVFNLTYDCALCNFYTFIQTTVYQIDVGKTRESPRVKELRAKLLNN